MSESEREREFSEMEFQSSRNEIKLFLEHPVWRDLRVFFTARIDDHVNMVLKAKASNIDNIRFSQGIIANAEDVLDFPQQMLDWLEDEDERDHE